MLRWRAIRDTPRLIAPDLVMGLVDPIEAESIAPVSIGPDPAHEIHAGWDVSPPPPLPVSPPQELVFPPKGDASFQNECEQDIPPPDPVTDAQLKKTHTSFNELGIVDREHRRNWIAAMLGRDCVSSSKDPTREHASLVIDALGEAIASRQKGAA